MPMKPCYTHLQNDKGIHLFYHASTQYRMSAFEVLHVLLFHTFWNYMRLLCIAVFEFSCPFLPTSLS